MNIAKGLSGQYSSFRFVSADKFGKAGKLQLFIFSNVNEDGR